MQKWESDRYTADSIVDMEKIQVFGERGWELVTVSVLKDGLLQWWFKRPVED
jgi:hypothetical protein